MEKEFKNQEKIGKKTAKLGIDCDLPSLVLWKKKKNISRTGYQSSMNCQVLSKKIKRF